MSNGEYVITQRVRLGGSKSSLGGDAGVMTIGDVGPVTPNQNRLRTALATTYAEATNTMSWSNSLRIRQVILLVTATDSAAAPPHSSENYCLVAVNAANETQANTWLTEADSESSAANFEKFLIGRPYIVRSTSNILRVDLLPVNVSATMSNFHAHAKAN